MKVHVAQFVRTQIATWIRQSEEEIGGLLLGRIQKSDGLISVVRAETAILAQGAELVGNSIHMTAELLTELSAQAKRQHPTFQQVGWFHTHNGLGAFFSSYDKMIHHEYFSGSGQIALVIDPELKKEAIYVWKDKEIIPYAYDAAPEPNALIPKTNGPARYRLVNPKRLMAAVVFAVIVVAGAVGFSRWRRGAAVSDIGGPVTEAQTGEGSILSPPPAELLPENPLTAAAQIPTAAVEVEVRKYVVQPDDTLWEISRRFYGHGSYFGLIMEHNRIDDPRQLAPGQELILPPGPAADGSL